MDNNYLQQIQKYLNNNNVQNDSNENISLNKNQLLECFQMLLNSKEQSNNNISNNISDNINLNSNQNNKEDNLSKKNTNQNEDSSNKKVKQVSPKPNINNYDDMPLPALKNKGKNSNSQFSSNNIDDIPIKGGSNFNELLEKEMLKEQNEGYYESNKNVEPKFKCPISLNNPPTP